MISIDEVLANATQDDVVLREDIDSEKELWLKETLSKKTIEELNKIGIFIYRLFCDDGHSYRTFHEFSFNRIDKTFRCKWTAPRDRFPFGDIWTLQDKSELMCLLTKGESREKQFALISQFLKEDKAHVYDKEHVGVIWGNCQQALPFLLRE